MRKTTLKLTEGVLPQNGISHIQITESKLLFAKDHHDQPHHYHHHRWCGAAAGAASDLLRFISTLFVFPRKGKYPPEEDDAADEKRIPRNTIESNRIC